MCSAFLNKSNVSHRKLTIKEWALARETWINIKKHAHVCVTMSDEGDRTCPLSMFRGRLCSIRLLAKQLNSHLMELSELEFAFDTIGKCYPTVGDKYTKAVDKVKKKLRRYIAEKKCTPMILRLA
ncbi:L-ascorbate peroxidase, cytosolic [Tanacetum coccineum]